MKSNKFEPVVVGRFANIIWITVGFILALVTIRRSYTPTYEFFFEHEMYLNRKALLKRLKRGPTPKFISESDIMTRWNVDGYELYQQHAVPYLISMALRDKHNILVISFDGIGYMSDRIQKKINYCLLESANLYNLWLIRINAQNSERSLR